MELVECLDRLCDIWAVADLSINRDELIETYGEDLCKYPFAIVIGHRMKEEIIENIPLTYTNDKLAQEYLDEYFNSHQRILKISEEIEKNLLNNGFKSVILDVSGTNEKLNLKSNFSNKASAHISGIGWIGKNNLLTTREFGPRLTWATILTDAPLSEYAGNPMDSLCDSCNICVKACPGGAIKDLDDPLKSYSPVKCGEYLQSRKDEGHPVACGMCLFICPYGNKKSRMLLD